MAFKMAETHPTKALARAKSAQERVQAFLQLFGGTENVLILINPDPDAIASALAVRRLLWKHVARAVIAAIRQIQRLENQAMTELLKIPMVQIDKVSPGDFSHKVLVDAQPNHSEIFAQFSYDAIIDHHPEIQQWDAPYVDIRSEYGATATILIEYLRGAKIKPSMNLATALLYAIKTDTANFERDATEEDVKQFRYVFHYANINLLRKIERSELRIGELRYFQTALQKRIIAKKAIYAHVGTVPSPDICVQIADFFMQIYGMGWSFVSGVYEDRLIIIIRNDGYRKDAGKLSSQAFGYIGSAGGHRGAARAEIPLTSLLDEGIQAHDSDLESFVRNRLNL